MKTTIRTLGKLPSEPMPTEVREELLKRFRTWKKAEKITPYLGKAAGWLTALL